MERVKILEQAIGKAFKDREFQKEYQKIVGDDADPAPELDRALPGGGLVPHDPDLGEHARVLVVRELDGALAPAEAGAPFIASGLSSAWSSRLKFRQRRCRSRRRSLSTPLATPRLTS